MPHKITKNITRIFQEEPHAQCRIKVPYAP